MEDASLDGSSGLTGPSDATDPTRKGFTAGTHRLVPPERTVERILARRASYGITRVADVTGLDHVGIPVVAVYRPNARSLVTAQGKGVTLAAAKASGLMEAVEAFHAERVKLPLRYASYRELRAEEPVVDPWALPRTRASRFHDDAQILWVSAWDMMGAAGTETSLVPFECVHTNFTLPLPAGSGCFMMSSNGLASGNHLLEAISHGLCEVVERHSSALFHVEVAAGAADRRRLDLESVEDPLCLEVLDRFAQAGIAVAAWDITSEVEIPCVMVEIVDERDDPGRLLYATSGLGCHLSPGIALLRALTEAAQCRLTYIAGARDDSDRDIYEQARNRSVIERARRRLLDGRGVARFHGIRDRSTSSLERDVSLELTALERAGVGQALVVDLSQRELGVSVVRVLVPGLEGIFDVPGYVPGPRARQKLAEVGR
jgi:ribosomal protein S12 methylthiotransferase accessory factor